MATGEGAGRPTLLFGALALFVAAPIAAAALTGFNLLRSSDLDTRAAAQEEVLGQIERRIAAQAAGARNGRDMAAIYVDAPSATLAKAELQQLIGKVVERAAARLVEVRGQDDEAPQEDGRIELQVTMDASNESLFKTLYEIETGLPLLSAEQIGIRKAASRTGTPDIDPVLRVTLLVRGHWRGAAK